MTRQVPRTKQIRREFLIRLRTGLLQAAVIFAAALISGCGNSSPGESIPPLPQEAAPAYAEPSAPAAVTDHQPSPSLPSVPDSETEQTDPALRALIGSAWQLREHRIWFLDRERVRVRSPQLEPYAPGGLVTRYRFENGAITMNVMGREIQLEWDGDRLRAEGFAAERLP